MGLLEQKPKRIDKQACLSNNLVNKEDLVLDLVVLQDKDMDLLVMVVLQEIKISFSRCRISNRMIQEELHNKEAHILTREALHQDILMLKEDLHQDIHKEDLLKEDHQARLETYLARNDWLCTL